MYLHLLCVCNHVYSHKDYMHPDVVHMYQNDNDDLHNDPNQQVNVNPMQESEEEWRHINFR